MTVGTCSNTINPQKMLKGQGENCGVFESLTALLFFAGSFSYRKDLDKVEKIALECED